LLGHSYPYQFPKYSSLVAAGSTTTNLRLKDPRTGQVIRYERMPSSSEEGEEEEYDELSEEEEDDGGQEQEAEAQ
jgi:hypothetical protein